MFCPKCGRENDSLAQFCQSCGNDLKGIQGTPVSTAPYAGFWTRVGAFLIDGAVIGAGYGVVAIFSVGILIIPAIIVGPWLYEAFMLSSAKQATLGKMAVGIKVTDDKGGRLSFGRATGRHFAKWLSGFFFLIGYIIAAFTEKKQALHDLIASTLVVSA